MNEVVIRPENVATTSNLQRNFPTWLQTRVSTPRVLWKESTPPASPSTVPPRWSSSPPPATTTTATTAAAVVGVRGSAIASHLDAQLSAVQQRAIHGVHCVLGVALVVKADEGEAPALLGVSVSGNIDVPDPSVLLKHSSKGLGLRSVRQVVHFEGSHAVDVRRRPTVSHGGGARVGPSSLFDNKKKKKPKNFGVSGQNGRSFVFCVGAKTRLRSFWVEFTRM